MKYITTKFLEGGNIWVGMCPSKGISCLAETEEKAIEAVEDAIATHEVETAEDLENWKKKFDEYLNSPEGVQHFEDLKNDAQEKETQYQNSIAHQVFKYEDEHGVSLEINEIDDGRIDFIYSDRTFYGFSDGTPTVNVEFLQNLHGQLGYFLKLKNSGRK